MCRSITAGTRRQNLSRSPQRPVAEIAFGHSHGGAAYRILACERYGVAAYGP